MGFVDFVKSPGFITGVFFVGVLLMIGSFGTVAGVVGNKDTYAEVSSTITGILVMNIIFTLVFTIGSILYFTRVSGNAQIFQMVLSGVAIFMSLTAVSVAVIQKAAE